MKKILITGCTGFVGKALFDSLKNTEFQINIAYRNNKSISTENIESFEVGEIDSKTDWSKALKKTDCVIHCAGRAHVFKELKNESLDIYRRINVEGTINLAEQAAANGVRRFIFLSSVKVNGERTVESSCFKYDDTPKPVDAYSISKWEAEKGLQEISKKTGLEIVIIRAPLIYGPGVKGNLKRLIKLVKSGIPLPLGLVKNHRSLIGIDNLIDIIIKCISHPKAARKTFLVCDGEDVSTSNLLKLIASSMGRSVIIFPIPLFLLKFFGFILRRDSEVERLTGSLQIDNSFIKKTLNWKPKVNLEVGISKMVNPK
jgi:nucleoside-diphosphate-sugar epimerase